MVPREFALGPFHRNVIKILTANLDTIFTCHSILFTFLKKLMNDSDS